MLNTLQNDDFHVKMDVFFTIIVNNLIEKDNFHICIVLRNFNF